MNLKTDSRTQSETHRTTLLQGSQVKLQGIKRSLVLSLEALQSSSAKSASRELEADPLDAAFGAIESYDRLASEVYRMRASVSSQRDPSFQKSLHESEELLATAAHDLVGFLRAEKGMESGYRLFVNSYRLAWRRHFGLFVFTACVFLITTFLGWNMGVNQPDYLPLLLSQEQMEMVIDHQAWFEKLQDNPILGGFQIAAGNIRVALFAFAGGALMGVGGLYVLASNGLNIGALLGYCWTHGFDEALLTFVTSHGPLELTIIIASSFASFLIGRVFFLRPYSLFRERMRVASQEAFALAVGIVPWLILAAVLEAGVSPWPGVSFHFKLALGIVASLAFWAWTFWPIKQPVQQPIKRTENS